LLDPAEQRPKTFYKGNDVIDQARLGFVSTVASQDGRPFERFDTALPGNWNSGHEFGTHLTDREKDAIVEYMKMF
jgi:hypothetical protein